MYMFSMFTNETTEEIDYKYIVNNILYDFVNNMFSYESIIDKMKEYKEILLLKTFVLFLYYLLIL